MATVLAAIGALIGAIFLSTRAVRNTAVTLMSVFACLLVGEGVIAYSQRPSPAPANGAAVAAPAPAANLIAHFEPEPLFVPDAALGWKLRPALVIALCVPAARTPSTTPATRSTRADSA